MEIVTVETGFVWTAGGGGTGGNGWTPELAVVSDGDRRVQRIVDWFGGAGTKPATGQYVGATGFVADIAQAVAIQGPQGPAGADGGEGPQGDPGSPGTNGRNPEYQFSATHLQYRLVGDATWIDLIPIANLEGPEGPQGPDGPAGADGAPGIDGKSVELQKSDTHIQWRLVGDSIWLNLVALADIKGDKGDTGDPGTDGAQGDSAYQVWQDAGNVGTVDDYLASLKGEKGDPGDAGADGSDGSDGAAGRSVQFFTEIPSGSFGVDYFAGDIVKL